MDDFVKKAFADATKSTTKEEAEAFENRISKNIESISVACGVAVGLGEMDKLSGAVIKAGAAETFSEWTRMVMIIAFSEGYEAARMAELGDRNG